MSKIIIGLNFYALLSLFIKYFPQKRFIIGVCNLVSGVSYWNMKNLQSTCCWCCWGLVAKKHILSTVWKKTFWSEVKRCLSCLPVESVESTSHPCGQNLTVPSLRLHLQCSQCQHSQLYSFLSIIGRLFMAHFQHVNKNRFWVFICSSDS